MFFRITLAWCVLPLAACSATADSVEPTEPTALAFTNVPWTWTADAAAGCADGSTTGFGSNLSPDGSSNVLVWFEGGALCYSPGQCVTHPVGPHAYSASTFSSEATSFGAKGIFDRSDATNPFADWSFVWVPYCTQDLHAGAHTMNYNGTTFHHVGDATARRLMTDAAGVFYAPAGSTVVLAGSSAGAYGALFHVGDAAALWPMAALHVLLDSGPELAQPYLPAAQQQAANASWATVYPASCGGGGACAAVSGADTGWHKIVGAQAAAFASSRFGFLSNDQDRVVSTGWGTQPSGDPRLSCNVGQPCEFGLVPASGRTLPGIQDFRVNVVDPAHGHVFYVSGTGHQLAAGRAGVSLATSQGGTTLASWLGTLLSGTGFVDVYP